MIGNQRDRRGDERLDQMGRELVRASAMNEAEGEGVAAAPFLYARLSARIKAEREQREEGERWGAMLRIVWRAIPAMAMVAILAVVLFLSANFNAQPAGVVSVEDLLETQGAGETESVVFADNRSLSNDEVLATILNEDEQEASR